jgi:hypothetical protein
VLLTGLARLLRITYASCLSLRAAIEASFPAAVIWGIFATAGGSALGTAAVAASGLHACVARIDVDDFRHLPHACCRRRRRLRGSWHRKSNRKQHTKQSSLHCGARCQLEVLHYTLQVTVSSVPPDSIQYHGQLVSPAQWPLDFFHRNGCARRHSLCALPLHGHAARLFHPDANQFWASSNVD